MSTTSIKPDTDGRQIGDPFSILGLSAIREIRNKAITLRDGDTFELYGYTFVMPGALIRANTRLMLANSPISVNIFSNSVQVDVTPARAVEGVML
jgi:hypothetical protein